MDVKETFISIDLCPFETNSVFVSLKTQCVWSYIGTTFSLKLFNVIKDLKKKKYHQITISKISPNREQSPEGGK